jgi:hypothetical protein
LRAFRRSDLHISDQELMLALDREISARNAARVNTHLSECWTWPGLRGRNSSD